MIYAKISGLKTTIHLSIPIGLKEKLLKLSFKTGENLNKLIIHGLLSTYPELKNDNTDLINKLLQNNK